MPLPPLAVMACLLLQAPSPTTAIDRDRIVIRDTPEDRPDAQSGAELAPPTLPGERSFWTPLRLTLGIATVIIAGVASSIVVRRSAN